MPHFTIIKQLREASQICNIYNLQIDYDDDIYYSLPFHCCLVKVLNLWLYQMKDSNLHSEKWFNWISDVKFPTNWRYKWRVLFCFSGPKSKKIILWQYVGSVYLLSLLSIYFLSFSLRIWSKQCAWKHTNIAPVASSLKASLIWPGLAWSSSAQLISKTPQGKFTAMMYSPNHWINATFPLEKLHDTADIRS